MESTNHNFHVKKTPLNKWILSFFLNWGMSLVFLIFSGRALQSLREAKLKDLSPSMVSKCIEQQWILYGISQGADAIL